MESVLLFFLVFLGLLLLGVPVASSLGFTSIALIWHYNLGIQVIASNFYANVAKFQLLALPFFILAGLILDRCGISKRLIRFVSLLVGPIPGGLAIVTIIVGVIFAGISGSGPADTAALGVILFPAMVAMGYNRGYTAALIAASGSLAIVIPPSIAFIIYGVITSTSIPALFAAGIIPGIITALFLIIPSYFIARKYGWKGEKWGTPREIWQAFKEALWGLLAPAVILSGIYGGVFTATEAAVVAVVYGLFLGLCVDRSLTLTALYDIFKDAALSSAVVMFIVAFAGLFSWTGSTLGVMDKASSSLLSLSSNPMVILLLINLMLFIAGMLMDAISIYYVFLPILIPIMSYFHWDPVWFGVIMTLNLAIGQITPPVAVNLYVIANISGLSLEEISKSVLPFVAIMLLALLITILFPDLSTFLPAYFGLK
ncbi:MAG: C4-dicarboxylate ABC transporter permease [Desulfobacca sp.]|nr:C4-dicarboxylate ABC transporter permease [Desulfobacca sp.]